MSENLTLLKNPSEIDLGSHGVIEASAGTGKTYTLERLYVRMLVEQNLDPSSIIAVTFTEKATAEIKTRVRGLLQTIVKEFNENEKSETLEEFCSQKADEILVDRLESIVVDFSSAEISTIHGFCRRILLEYAEVSGFSEDLQVAGDLSFIYKSELHNALYDFGNSEYGSSELFSKTLIDNTEKYMQQFLNPSYTLENIDDQTEFTDEEKKFYLAYREGVINRFRENVQQRKKELKLFDFDDLLIQTADLLKNNEDIRLELAERFKFGMIDEFQDTDPLQYSIFRQIFIESQAPNRLFIIGDPKQSIYRFKGADVFTYREAKEQIIEKYQGRLYSLQNNYRSAPLMIEAFNRIFSTKTEEFWFKDGYPEAKVPGQKTGKVKSEKEKSIPVRFVKFDLKNELTSNKSKDEYYRLIPDLISDVIHEMPDKNKKEDNFKLSDIAILVRSGKESAEVSEILSEAGIPCTSGKRGNLYASDEAKHVYYLLKALEEPYSDAALNTLAMTGFFGGVTEKVNADFKVNRQVKNQVFKWHETMQSGHWAELFVQIEHDSGLINRFINDIDYERKITDYRHLFQSLADYAETNRAGLLELVVFLEKKIWGEKKKDDDEEYKRRIETDEDKVQIITMHSAKGLEFKAVIVAGGFAAPPKKKDIVFHNKSNNKRIIGLYSSNSNKKITGYEKKPSEIAKDEELEELKRLYYVAFTRAESVLILPLTMQIERAKGKNGLLGTVNGNSICFHDRISDNIWVNHSDNNEIINEWFTDNNLFTITHEAEWDGSNFIFTKGQTGDTNAGPVIGPSLISSEQKPVKLHIPEWQFLPGYIGRQVTSFSSLVKKYESDLILSETAETTVREDDEVDTEKSAEQTYRLPSGAQTGNYLHHIFEHSDFYGVNTENLTEEIKERIRRALPLFYRNLNEEKLNSYAEDTEKIFYRTVNAVLTGKDKVRLCEVAFSDTRRELEFLWQGGQKGKGILLTGFIDLVFRVGKHYYILDYKSNTLPAYNQKELEKIMNKSYRLQGQLYAGALHSYLKKTLNGYKAAENFGGCYFMFLRGIEPGKDNGIFYMPPPSEKQLDAYAELVSFNKTGNTTDA